MHSLTRTTLTVTVTMQITIMNDIESPDNESDGDHIDVNGVDNDGGDDIVDHDSDDD